MHTILETFISVAHNAPPSTHTHHQWWNWFLSQSHTHACTQTHQRYHRLFIKVHFPNRFLPINLSIFPLFFLHVFLVSTYMVLTFAWWNTGTSSSTEMLCSSPHHTLKLAALHTARQLCSLNSGCHTVPIVSGKQEGTGSYTVEMQCSSVVIRENNGTLSAKCVWLSQIANYRQRRWAGTGQAQCLHKHTSIHTHTQRQT